MLSFFDIYFIYHNINYRTNVLIWYFGIPHIIRPALLVCIKSDIATTSPISVKILCKSVFRISLDMFFLSQHLNMQEFLWDRIKRYRLFGRATFTLNCWSLQSIWQQRSGPGKPWSGLQAISASIFLWRALPLKSGTSFHRRNQKRIFIFIIQ